MNPWVILVAASVCEVVMALGLKWSDGFARLGGSLLAIGGGVVSMALPVGTGYAVWTGLGAVFTALGESRDTVRIAGIVAVVTGVVLLQLAEHH